jgi:hypothetical protein
MHCHVICLPKVEQNKIMLNVRFFVEISDIYVRLSALGKTIKMWSILYIWHQPYLFCGKSVCLIRGITSVFGCRNWGKPHRAKVRIFRAPAEIQTKDLSNIIQKRYRLNQIVVSRDGELRKTVRIVEEPITVAATSKAWIVFARSNTGIVHSNPTRGVDVCVCVYSVCVVLFLGSGLAMGWSPVQGVLPTVYRIKKTEKIGQGPKVCRARERERERNRRYACSIKASYLNKHQP